MKIEIELSEVESLRDQLVTCKKEINKLEEKLKEINEPVLKEKAIALAKWLFDNYMECVFKGLGFDQKMRWERSSVSFPSDIEHRLGPNWWNNSERLSIEISADVSSKFRKAFLSIGVNPNPIVKEDTLEWVDIIKPL